ncbi:hypothetical protein [Spongiactinospora sp. 9N601]|uniref:hypothetical protein n=1 Tax=Spongiactinospora sp. 9N601 TaxID=3375149 RepID=UPI0037B6C559
MSRPEFFATPGYGETQLANMHYYQAVRIGDRAPIWTETGVPALGAPKMRVEIRVTAIIGRDD